MAGTDGKTCAAADTFVPVDAVFAVDIGDRLHLTAFLTEPAFFAHKSHDPGLHPQMHGHLAAFGGKSHGKLLDGAAETCQHVSFEMRKHQDLFMLSVMLVSALAGKEHVMAAYVEAVKERYRFFSFGDAMFVTNDTTEA